MWSENIKSQKPNPKTQARCGSSRRPPVGIWILGFGICLPLPQFGELQKDRVRVDDRNDQARDAVEHAEPQQVVSEKCRKWMDDEIEEAGAAAGLVHLTRRQGGVVVDPIEVFFFKQKTAYEVS